MRAGERTELIAVVGPTATGKSDLAIRTVHALGGPSSAEIISADAMQLYRGMDIGTAKVLPAQQGGVAHHQIDVLDITQPASVAAYQSAARQDAHDIQGRGRTPIVVGGSGLYLRAFLDKLEFPGTDARARHSWEKLLEESGPSALHQELLRRDPIAANRIGPQNGRRLVRALEVIDLTGRPYSATLPKHEHWKPTLHIGLRGDLELLDARIASRSQEMFDQGFVDEVKELDRIGLRQTKTAIRATGYPEALAVLDGELTVEEGVKATSLATSRLVRKQMKWFKRDPRIHWFDFSSPTLDEEVSELVLAHFSVSA